jgi:hypothetical protein
MQNNVHWACIICIIIIVQCFKLRRLTVVTICSIGRGKGSMCYIAVLKGHESGHLGELVTRTEVNLWEIQSNGVNSWWKSMLKKKRHTLKTDNQVGYNVNVWNRMNWLHLVSAGEHSNSRMWATVSNTCMIVHWSRKTHMHNFAALEGMLKEVIITYMLGFCCRNCLDSEFFLMQLLIRLSPAFAKYMYHYWKHHHWCGCGHCKPGSI